MFDIEKARDKGIDERSIAIMQEINENNARREKCIGHDFEMMNFGKYHCKNCGYESDIKYVLGYQDAQRHMGFPGKGVE